MRTNHTHGIVGDFGQVLHGVNAHGSEALNFLLIVNQLPQHIGGTIFLLVDVVGVHGFVDGFFYPVAKARVFGHLNYFTLGGGGFSRNGGAFRRSRCRH